MYADLFLDTFNFNGHKTIVDALCSGLPVLTKLGNTFSARVAGSLLQSVDLYELVANSKEEYTNTAIELAQQPKKLKIMREKLSLELTKQLLFNSEKYVKKYEKKLTEILDHSV